MIHHLSIAGVLAMSLFIGIRYCWLIVQRRIQPALAMWVFFTIAVAGSLGTFLAEGQHGLWDNIQNTMDLALVVTVSVVIYVYGDRSTRFTRFDLGCTAAVLAILVFWLVTRSHVLSNLAIQLILLVAYAPVVRRLWHAAENTESYAAWVGMTISPFFALLSSQGLLASLYAYRSILCTSALLVLMARTSLRARARNARGGLTAAGEAQ